MYKLATAGNESVLFNFPGGNGGWNPNSGVIFDSAGNLYGTTFDGGPANGGIVYKLDPTGHETVLHSFTDRADGVYPTGGLTLDSASNVYGTSSMSELPGGPLGVVYKINTAGHFTVLYSFGGGADGAFPGGGVIRDSAGNLYGTTSGGGAYWGVVFKLDANNQETVLYTFPESDGFNPTAGLARDSAGNLYGTTYYGGIKNLGTVFKLDTTGHETVLHSFLGGSDGSYPAAGVYLDSGGNMYGTTQRGGVSGAGVVYSVDVTGQEKVLYTFTGGADGGVPGAGTLIQDSAGNFYGTTSGGGTAGE